MNSFSVWSIFCKLNHNLSAINIPPIKLLHCLLGLISILIPYKCKTSGITGPPIPGNEDINNLPILVEKRKKVISSSSEGNVEDEERVGVSDIRRTSSAKV